MKTNQILQGHILDVLKTLPSESIDSCITSPPYWALRNYDTKSQVWDGGKKCQHKFRSKIIKWHGDRGPGKKKEVFDDSFQVKGTSSAFCVKCDAWKGSLGLEPHFDLYIKHLCDIFDEVKRVLKKTGTCWVVIGDTYWSASGSCHNPGGNKDSLEDSRKKKNVYPLHRGNKSDQPNLKPKSLTMIPARFAFEMCNRGWLLRNEIIWHKPNCMPSSTKDRFTVDFEKLFFFTKSKKYYFEQQFEPIDKGTLARANRAWYGKKHGGEYAGRKRKERGEDIDRWAPSRGRNKRCVWTITTKPYKNAHFAVFPEKLIETPIRASCPRFVCNECGKAKEKIYGETGRLIGREEYGNKTASHIGVGPTSSLLTKKTKEKVKIGYTDCGCGMGFRPGIVMDPFLGSGTTAVVAKKLNRNWVGIELNSNYIKLAEKRIANAQKSML